MPRIYRDSADNLFKVRAALQNRYPLSCSTLLNALAVTTPRTKSVNEVNESNTTHTHTHRLQKVAKRRYLYTVARRRHGPPEGLGPPRVPYCVVLCNIVSY